MMFEVFSVSFECFTQFLSDVVGFGGYTWCVGRCLGCLVFYDTFPRYGFSLVSWRLFMVPFWRFLLLWDFRSKVGLLMLFGQAPSY